jgi:hypothetical protein
VTGERIPETVAEVVGERGNVLEGVGGVVKGDERAEKGKKGSKETVDAVVIAGVCREIGELGIEIGLGPSTGESAHTAGMIRGESFGRLNARRSVPGSCLIFLT